MRANLSLSGIVGGVVQWRTDSAPAPLDLVIPETVTYRGWKRKKNDKDSENITGCRSKSLISQQQLTV